MFSVELPILTADADSPKAEGIPVLGRTSSLDLENKKPLVLVIDDGGGRCVTSGLSCGSNEQLTDFATWMRSELPADCNDILAADDDAPDGIYTIDPDGAGGRNPFEVNCDMNTEGGGWTLCGNIDEVASNAPPPVCRRRRQLHHHRQPTEHLFLLAVLCYRRSSKSESSRDLRRRSIYQ